MTKKIKTLLMTGVLALSTISLAACNNQNQGENSENTQTEQQTDQQTESKVDQDKQDKSEEKNKETVDAKKTKEIIYYTYDINSDKVTPHTEKVEEVSVGNIVKAMVKDNILPKDTEVKSAKVEEIDGVRTLVVDMNSNFINFDQGSSAELLMLQCFTNSLIKSFKVEQVSLTVEGEPYSSGHIAYDEGEFLKFK